MRKEVTEIRSLGAALEIRWLRPNGGKGQEYTFERWGSLLHVRAGAGIPDIVGPTILVITFERWRQDVPILTLFIKKYLEES